jgi:bacillithiol system protein YtxJ
MNNWNLLKNNAQLEEIVAASEAKPQIIFKDSTRCGRSAHAKQRLAEGEAHLTKADRHYLDLLEYRSISNLIADTLGVTHQSPQIIVLKNGGVAYHVSHEAIEPAIIAKHL